MFENLELDNFTHRIPRMKKGKINKFICIYICNQNTIIKIQNTKFKIQNTKYKIQNTNSSNKFV